MCTCTCTCFHTAVGDALDTAGEEGASEHKEEVGKDRAQKRDLDDAEHAGLEREKRDDQLRDISKGGVEQAAEGLARVESELLGDETQPLGERGDREEREREHPAVAKVLLVRHNGKRCAQH